MLVTVDENLWCTQDRASWVVLSVFFLTKICVQKDTSWTEYIDTSI